MRTLIATMKNRVPELGSSGTVRGEGSNVLAYSDPVRHDLISCLTPYFLLDQAGAGVLCHPAKPEGAMSR